MRSPEESPAAVARDPAIVEAVSVLAAELADGAHVLVGDDFGAAVGGGGGGGLQGGGF